MGLNHILVHLCTFPTIPTIPGLAQDLTCLLGISSHQPSPSFDLLPHVLLCSLSSLAILSQGQPPFPDWCSSLQKIEDCKHEVVQRENRQAPEISCCTNPSEKLNECIGQSRQCLVEKLKRLQPKSNWQRNCLQEFLWRVWLKHPIITGMKIPPRVEHLCILNNSALISIKHLFCEIIQVCLSRFLIPSWIPLLEPQQSKKVPNSKCDGLQNVPEFDLEKPLKWPLLLAF